MRKNFTTRLLFIGLFFILCNSNKSFAQQFERLPVMSPEIEQSVRAGKYNNVNPASHPPSVVATRPSSGNRTQAPTNVLINNNTGSTGTQWFTQSETTIIQFGSTIVAGFNDAGSNATGSKFTGWSRSTDGGITFTDGGTLPTNAGGDAGDPSLGRNNTTGRIYFSTLGFTTSTIQVFNSDDGGLTWSAPVNGTPGGATEDKQWLTVDNFAGAGNGNVYILSRNFGGGNGIRFYRSTDNGATYGPSGGTLIVTGMQGAFIAVGPDHSIYAFWYAGATLQVRKSTDQGVTFGAPVTVASGLVGGVNGNLGLTGMRQGTATFNAFRSNEFPHAAINPVSGHIYVTYNNDGPGADKADVFYVKSTDGGATWSAPFQINDDATTTDQWMPTIAVSPDGLKVGIFYYSRQEDPANNNLFKYYGRLATVSGTTLTFDPSAAVSDVASLPEFGRDAVVNAVYMGDYNFAVGTATAFSVVWSDNRDDLPGGAPRKDPQVYYASVPFSTTPTPVIAPGTATLTAEGCVPNNAVIDPGETVTISFCALNVGTANTTNLVGTMQVSGGVTPISGPQNYGVVTFGGPAVCRSFTFSNTSGVCGGTITVTIQWQDGATNLGTSTWNFTLGTLSTALLPNGGFETGTLPPWTIIASNPAPVVNGVSPRTGAFAAFLGNLPGPEPLGDASMYQQFTVPASGGILSFWYRGYTEDGITFDWQDAYITNTSNTILATIMHVCTTNPYTQVTYNLAPFAGQTVRLQFLVHQDNFGDVTNMYVDDVSISQYTCCGAACTITCPANITVSSSPGVCGANVTYPAPTTTGLCGPVTSVPASGSFFPVGTTTVTATTAAGPSCTFTITVVDNVPPTITCPANITRNNDPNLCSAVVTYPLPVVTDNCPPPVPVQFPASFENHGSGTVFTLSGNLLPGGLFFTITNNSAQTRIINNFGVRFGNPSFGVVTAPQTLTIFSRPGGLTTAIENSTAGWTTQGPQIVNPIPPYFATGTGPLGICGLSTPVVMAPGSVFSFFIHGQTACPAFNYNGAILPPVANGGFTMAGGTISFGQLGTANHFNQGTRNGIINIQANYSTPLAPPIQLVGLPSGSAFPVGVTTNTFQATDGAGNTSTCSFNVTVVDNQAPSVTCPTNIVANTDVGACVATVPTPNPANSDNCGVTSVSWVMTGATTGASPLTGINYLGTQAFNLNGTTGQGVTTVTYTVKDAAGNTTTCSYTVTVNDAWIPVIGAGGQPSNQFVCVGSAGAFTVTASVPAGNPLTYQWQAWNGSAWVNITGATNATLPLPGVTFSMNTNSYRCILTGRCSIVTSGFATLYVNPLPTISLLASRPLALLPGQNLTLTAVVSPGGGSYQWKKNGSNYTGAATGATSSTLSGLTVDDIGSYTCTYTDLNGCVKTSDVMVVTGLASSKLYVYPNPNLGVFQIRFFNSANEAVNVNIFNSLGQRVWSKALTTSNIAYSKIEVDISNLAADIYTAQVVNGAGKIVGARKFVMVKQ